MAGMNFVIYAALAEVILSSLMDSYPVSEISNLSDSFRNVKIENAKEDKVEYERSALADEAVHVGLELSDRPSILPRGEDEGNVKRGSKALIHQDEIKQGLLLENLAEPSKAILTGLKWWHFGNESRILKHPTVLVSKNVYKSLASLQYDQRVLN